MREPPRALNGPARPDGAERSAAERDSPAPAPAAPRGGGTAPQPCRRVVAALRGLPSRSCGPHRVCAGRAACCHCWRCRPCCRRAAGPFCPLKIRPPPPPPLSRLTTVSPNTIPLHYYYLILIIIIIIIIIIILILILIIIIIWSADPFCPLRPTALKPDRRRRRSSKYAQLDIKDPRHFYNDDDDDDDDDDDRPQPVNHHYC